MHVYGDFNGWSLIKFELNRIKKWSTRIRFEVGSTGLVYWI